MKQQPSVEQEAQMRVDQMSAEMPLTDKQAKKLLKFYKKDIKYRRENFQMAGGPGGNRGGQGMRPGNPPGGDQQMGQEIDFEIITATERTGA